MCKAVVFLLFLVLVSGASGQTNAEAGRLLKEGMELTETGQLPEAVRALEGAIKSDPHYADAYAALGRAYFKMRLWRQAVDNINRASALRATQRQTVSTTPQQQPAPPPVAIKNEPAPEETPKPIGVEVSMSAAPAAAVNPIPLKPSNEDVSLTKIYRVGPGDVLDVRINEPEPRQSTLFTITSAGQLEHPLFPEPLNVSALTTEEIGTKLHDDLKKRALIENPEVTVGVRDYASHAILVSGLVKESGTKYLRREAIPLYVVVADAQPLPEAARVTVVRNEKEQMFEIDLTKVTDMNLLVRPGDVVNLQRNEAQFIYVGGEVKAPGEKTFRRGLTLTQAIISAGGVTPKSKIAEVGRDDGQGFLVKTSFSLKDIHTGKALDPLIQPGDRIMVLR